MKKWIANLLFDMAVRLDTEGAIENSKLLIEAERKAEQIMNAFMSVRAPKKKVGRPKGAKDRVAGRAATPPKKIGRPLGSKNKPKVVA